MDYEGKNETATDHAMGEAAFGAAGSDLMGMAQASSGIASAALVPDANNTVVLPDGATLDDISVRGRDLVIVLDDGRTFIIPDGAVFVPQIVSQGVAVPPLNLAALLIGNEPEPAAGAVRSSGGNFAVPVDPIQDAYNLGDLLPYTELAFPEPKNRELFPIIDRKPITGPNADILLDDDALAGGNPGGTGDDADAANLTGTLAASGGDGSLTWTLSTAGAPAGFTYVANGTGIDVFQGATLVLQVTLNAATGAYTVTQVAPIQHDTGNNENNAPFTLGYTVTDSDGDTATGTVNINVDDDSPVAANDTDTVAAGTYGPETGNILTGAGTTSGAAGADRIGADGAAAGGAVTAVTGTAPGTIGGTTAGQYGTLTLNANGTYSYVRNAGTPGGVNDTFTYTITDRDGDTATATLTINIADALPLAGENRTVLLDDDALAGGNPGGTGDDVDAAGTAGTLAASGGDGPLAWALSTAGAPAGFSYVANGTGINVFQGTTLVMQVTLNTATGAYTVTQVAPIQHVAGSDENNQTFTLNYIATDVDGDTAAGTLTVNVDDDTPTSTVSEQGEISTLIVDETNLVGTTTQGMSSLFSHSFGADGAGSIGYSLSVVAGTSGLVDSLSGEDIILSVNAGVVEGRTATGGLLVFTVSVDASGDVTLTQYRAIIHDPDFGPNDIETVIHDSVMLTQTVTDSDGDSALATINIGGFLGFVDDAPTAAADTDTIASGTYGPETGNVLDGTGTTSGAAGADSTGADGAAAGGAVTAVTGTAAGTIGGTTTGTYGTLTLNADGSYSYVRSAGTPGGVSDVFTYTVTDADGDTATATLTITIDDALPITAPNALVQLDDDALAGGNPGGTGDDPDAVNVTGTLAGSGGDGPLTWQAVSFTSPVGFVPTLVNPGLIEVRQGATLVFTIAFDTATGAYTITQVAPIDHSALDDENNTGFSFGYRVVDQDGDIANGSIAINIDDDTPVVSNDTDSVATGTYGPETGNVLTGLGTTSGAAGADSLGADGAAAGGAVTAISGAAAGAIGGSTAGTYGVLTMNADGSYSYTRNAGTPGGVSDVFTYTVTDGDGDNATATLTIDIADALPLTGENRTVLLDDDALGGGNAGGTGDDVDAAGTAGTLAASGGDGPLSWALDTTGAPAGFSYVANGTGIDVFQGTTLVMQVTLNTATGAYTVTQVAPIAHDAGSDENNQAFTLNYTVTDQDGDTAAGTFSVNVDDDTPVALDDTDTVASGTYGPEAGNVLTGAGTTSGAAGADSIGADGAAVGGAVTAVTGGTIGGTTAGTYGTLTLNADGSYSYVRNAGTPGGVSDVFTYTITDADGDSTTATLTIAIEDARPITAPNALVQLDDDALAGGNPGGTGDDPDAVNVTGTLSGSGGDGPLTWQAVSFTSPVGFTPTLVNPGLIEVRQGATLVFTIAFDTATGAYTITQVAPIDHSALGDENNTGFSFGYRVVDQDGDIANGSIAINIDDDTPVVSNDTDSLLAGATGPATGNVLTDAAAGDAGDTDTGADSLGADGGSVTGITGFGGPGTIGGTTTGQYGTLTLNADGSYSYTRSGTAPLSASDTFTYTVTDGDGDTATATLIITIEDAGPITGQNLTVLLDDDAQAGGNPGGTGDDADSANATGFLAGSGGDGALTWTATSFNSPAGFTATLVNPGLLEVRQGTTLVMTIAIDNATGAYTVTQVAPIDHSALDDENNSGFTFGYQVTDADGDTASGSLSISIDDDTPVVLNDTDSVASGTYGPETGNVLTGLGTTSGAAGADSLGADGAATGGAVTAVTGTAAGTIGGTTTGTYGVLTMNADGSYSYVRNAGTPAGVSDVFTYTVTDGDGDTATATLTINIADALPITGPNALVQLDDDALAGGNPGGTGDDPDAVNVTGTLAGSGGDGPLTWQAVSFTSPVGSVPTLVNPGLIEVRQGATLVFTIAFDTATGAYTITQVAPIDHSALGDENNTGFSFGYRVVDQDGDIANGSIAINIDDDTPTVTSNATVLLDDDTLGGNPGGAGDDVNTANAIGVLGHSYGADGAGAIAFTTGGAPAGFSYVANGTGIDVFQGATLVMQVTLNATTGAYTVSHVAPIVHDAGSDENNQAFTLTYTVTDGDGDTVNGTLDINVDDDTPIALVTSFGATVDEDGLAGGNPGGVGDAAATSAATSGSVTGLFAGGADVPLSYSLAASTAGLPALSSGGVALTYSVVGNVLTASAGATPVFTFTLNAATGAWDFVLLAPLDHAPGGNENDILIDLGEMIIATDSDGDSVQAVGNLIITVDDDTPVAGNDTDTVASGTYGPEAGNVLTGAGTTSGAAGADSVGADGPATAGAVTAVTGAAAGTIGGTTAGTYGLLTLNGDGSYSYTRNAGTPGGVNDVFTYTVTDADGDTATATLTITIADAAPLAGTNLTVLLDDDTQPGGNAGGTGDDANSANTTGTLAASGGDGPLAWALSTAGAPAGFSYVANGTGINVFQGATQVLTITLNAATGAYTVTQVAPIDHPAGSDENNQIFTLSYTVTDQDSDSANGTLSINVDDDTPVAAIAAGTIAMLHDETPGITAGTNEVAGPLPVFATVTNVGDDLDVAGTGAIGYAVGTGSFSTAGSAPGADGWIVSYALAISSPGVDSGVDTTSGQNIFLFEENGLIVGRVGSAAGAAAFAVSINPLTGQISMVQYLSVYHPDGNNANDTVSLIQSAISAVMNIVDGDGDATSSSAGIGDRIQFRDDGPLVANDTDSVASGTYGPETGNVLTGAGTTSGAAGADSFGADGQAAGGGVTAISGAAVGTIGGATNGTYGVLTMNADGSYSYVRSAGTPGGVSDVFTYTVTDGDGDTATATLTISIADAVPMTAPNAAVLLDDDALAGGNAGGTGDNVDAANTAGTLAASGGDGPLVWALSTAGAPAGFSYVANGTGINVLQGTTLVMQVTLNTATGAYVVTQVAPIQHAAGADENNTVFTLGYTVADVDGDTAAGTLSISVDDDSPLFALATTGANLIVDESLGTTGSVQNEGGRVNNDETLVGAASGAIGYATGSVTSITTGGAGADGEASRNYTLSVTNSASGLVDAMTNQNIVLVLNGSVVEGRVGSAAGALSFTIGVNSASGQLTINQFRSIEHNDSADHDENGASAALMSAGRIGLNLTISDTDGDSATSSADISQVFRFEDDGPLANPESGSVSEVTVDYNTAFVLDFSGSINSTEYATMMNAVKAAVSALFDSTGGNVTVRFVPFAGTAPLSLASGVFTTEAAALAQLDAWIASRPLSSGTDYTAAIETLTQVFAADATAQNRIFFLSDGNPNEQLGSSGQALSDTIRPLWNSFINNSGPNISVTAIGVGSTADVNDSNLQQIDVDGDGDPIIRVADFDDLINALTDLFLPNPISGDLDLNDDFGTDGGRILSITIPLAGADATYTWNGVTGAGSQIVVTGAGATTINGATSITAATELGGSMTFNFTNGQWSYTPPATIAANANEVFNYTIVDGDGDTSSSNLTVTVVNDQAPTTVPVTATVDDDALAGGISGGTGDLDANIGETPASSSEAVYNGTLGVTFGPDGAGRVSFAQLQGQTVAVGIETATLTWNAVTNVLTATGPRGVLFTVTVTNPVTGAYTVNLLDNVLHSNVADENDAAVALTYRVSDGNGTTANGVLNITFDDDSPIAVVPTAVSLTNAAGAPVLASLDASLLNNYGADGGTPRFSPTLNGTNSGLSSSFVPIIYTVSPNGLSLIGKAGATTIFTITLLPGTNQYSVDMDGTVDSLTTINFDSGAYQFVGGNTAWVALVPNGQDTTGGAINDNSRDLLITPAVSGAPTSTVNGSSVALGVGSGNDVNTNEMIRIDFVVDLVGNTGGSGGYSVVGNRDHSFDSHYVTNGASALLTASAGSVVKVTARDDFDADNVVGDGTIDPITRIVIAYNGVASAFIIPTTTPTNYVVNGITYTVTLNADGSVNVGGVEGTSGAGAIGTQIAAFTANGYSSLEFAHVSGDGFKLGNFGAVAVTTNPVNFTIPVQVIDGDGDVSASANLAITLTAPVSAMAAKEFKESGDDDVESISSVPKLAFNSEDESLADASFALTGAQRAAARSAELVAASSVAAAGLLAAMAMEHASTFAHEGLARGDVALTIASDTGLPDTSPLQAQGKDSDISNPVMEPLAKLAPESTGSLGHDDGPAMGDGIGQLTDHLSELHNAPGNDNTRSALFGNDHASSGMLGQVSVPGAGAAIAAHPAVVAALADGAGAEAVDSIVDHFAPNSVGAMEFANNGGAFDLQGLLNMNINGGGDSMMPHFSVMNDLDHDQISALT